MNPAVAAIATVAILAVGMIWVDSRLLADLAATPDERLYRFDRRTWALIIIVSFPVGPLLYLRYAKGPNRYA
jgi:hypothetical protein